ncbi:unnamed protein product [Caenorhabditis brenneri]
MAGNEEFPESESWWGKTDTREEWAVPVKREERREVTSLALKQPRKEPERCISTVTVDTEETNKPEERCEIVVNTTKRYFSGGKKVKLGMNIIEDQCFIPASRIPMKVYINVSPDDSDRFDALNKHCDGTFFSDFVEERSDAGKECGKLEKRRTKVVKLITDGQYEERTEYKYTFPKTANITFIVAMHSEESPERV